jgi:hypothetical protein
VSQNEARTVNLSESGKPLSSSEVVSQGARLSPFEDFQARTLSSLPGLWTKLLYMAGLRCPEGKYRHWGHSRVHGESPSQLALARAHSELYITLLRRPMRELIEEIEMNSGGADPTELVRRIEVGEARMVPANLEGGSPRHFSSIVLAVRFRYERRRDSSHSAA